MGKIGWNNTEIVDLGKRLNKVGVSFFNSIVRVYDLFRSLSAGETRYWTGKNYNKVANFLNEHVDEFVTIANYLSNNIPKVIMDIAVIQARDDGGSVDDIAQIENVDISINPISLTEEKADGSIYFDKLKIADFLSESESSRESFYYCINGIPDGVRANGTKYSVVWQEAYTVFKDDDSMKDLYNAIVEENVGFIDEKIKKFYELIKEQVEEARSAVIIVEDDTVKKAKQVANGIDTKGSSYADAKTTSSSILGMAGITGAAGVVSAKNVTKTSTDKQEQKFVNSADNTSKDPKFVDSVTTSHYGVATPGTNFAGKGSSEGDGVEVRYTVGDKTYNVYSQYSGPYKDHYYWPGSSHETIWGGGCGISSASMIISGYGYDVNPGTLADRGNIPNGNDLNNYVKEFKNYNIDSHIVWGDYKNEAVKNLNEGRPVMLNLNNSTISNENISHYYGGHYLTILGVNEEGKVFVGDSGEVGTSGYYNVDQLFSGFNINGMIVVDS